MEKGQMERGGIPDSRSVLFSLFPEKVSQLTLVLQIISKCMLSVRITKYQRIYIYIKKPISILHIINSYHERKNHQTTYSTASN